MTETMNMGKAEIATDLNARVSEAGAASKEYNAMSPQEKRLALQSMNQGKVDLPSVKLVSNDSGATDNLNPGGANFGVGAIVPSGAVGVVTHMGRVDAAPLGEGYHWKLPFYTNVEMMSTRLHTDKTQAQAASKDLQQVSAELTVPFTLKASDAPAVYQKIGNLEQVESNIINPGVLESVKSVMAQYTAEELVTKRELVKTKVEEQLKAYVNEALHDKGIPAAVAIGNVAITHFDFSPEFNKSIELKVKAEQDALRAENEKRQKITEAEATRDSQKARADGEAYATKVQSQAEADAIRIKAAALKDNPDIVNLNAVQKWDGKLPVYTGGAPVPFIKLDELTKHSGEK